MSILARMTLGALLLLPELARADAAAPLPADGELAYVQRSGQGCVAGLWDSKDRKTRVESAVTECPQAVSLTSHGRTLVLIGDTAVRTFDLSSGKLGEPMTLPDKLPTPLDTEELRAGYTPDGMLALEMVAGRGDQSSDEQLYLRKGGTWMLAEQVHCRPFATGCPLKQPFEANRLYDAFGTGPDEIWNDALAGDPYVVKHIPEKVAVGGAEEEEGGGEGTPNNCIVFHVYGRYSKLLFGAQAADDTDGTLTFGMKLVTPDNLTVTITDGQFDATILGHYLLFDGFFGGGMRLYDLGNGKVVLDELAVAGWLQ